MVDGPGRVVYGDGRYRDPTADERWAAAGRLGERYSGLAPDPCAEVEANLAEMEREDRLAAALVRRVAARAALRAALRAASDAAP